MTNRNRLQPCPTPEPGRPFVNRKAELQLIENKLHHGCRGDPMAMVVVCFWGAFGIGKSWVLGELARRYRRNGSPLERSHAPLTARLDMNPDRLPSLWHEGRLDVRQVVQELWKQLALQMGTSAAALGRTSAEEYTDRFVEQVTAWLAYATPILMLDTMDIVVRDDEEAFFWLEEHLVERLALTDRVLFVFASRGELRRWRRFQVRRRVDSYPLIAFDADFAGQEVKANQEVSQVLYRHAFGHPLATEYLGRALEKQGIDPSTARAQEAEEALEPSLVQATLGEVMEQILEMVPKSLAKLARDASVLRWVNVEPLRHLAEALGLAEPGGGDARYLDLIGQLQVHHLLYWDVDTASYKSDPAVRQLLAYSLELDDREQFRKAHLAAYHYHQDHLERHPQYLARYVPEAAYHHAILTRGEPLPDGVLSFGDWWSQFSSSQAPHDAEPWSELVATLEKDAELSQVLPADEYEPLYSEARERAFVA